MLFPTITRWLIGIKRKKERGFSGVRRLARRVNLLYLTLLGPFSSLMAAPIFIGWAASVTITRLSLSIWARDQSLTLQIGPHVVKFAATRKWVLHLLSSTELGDDPCHQRNRLPRDASLMAGERVIQLKLNECDVGFVCSCSRNFDENERLCTCRNPAKETSCYFYLFPSINLWIWPTSWRAFHWKLPYWSHLSFCQRYKYY